MFAGSKRKLRAETATRRDLLGALVSC